MIDNIDIQSSLAILRGHIQDSLEAKAETIMLDYVENLEDSIIEASKELNDCLSNIVGHMDAILLMSEVTKWDERQGWKQMKKTIIKWREKLHTQLRGMLS